MNTLDRAFVHAMTVPSDINEHIPVLGRLAASSRLPVIEFGTRTGVSTTAFLWGKQLYTLPYLPHVISCDIDRKPEIDSLYTLAKDNGIVYEYVHFDTTKNVRYDLPTLRTDLLFIDTWHVEEQVYVELTEFAQMVIVGGYLVFHDTVTFWEKGESDGHRGLGYGIVRFLQETDMAWNLVSHFENNNGLLVLQRSQNAEKDMGDACTRLLKFLPGLEQPL